MTVPQLLTPPATDDAGTRAQRAAEEHLVAIYEAESAAEDPDHETDPSDPDAEPVPVLESPACGPWCGCETCLVREVLYAAWPILEADVVDRLRAAGFNVAADLIEQQAADAAAANDPNLDLTHR